MGAVGAQGAGRLLRPAPGRGPGARPDGARGGAVGRNGRAGSEAADCARAVLVPRRRCLQAYRSALRWRAQPGCPRETGAKTDKRARPRRAHEPPRPLNAAEAPRGAREVPGHDSVRGTRSGDPRPNRDASIRGERRNGPGADRPAAGLSEGTIEHTLMAPVSRAVHLIGMSIFGVLHAIVRTLLIFAIAVPFFSVDLGQANWFAAAVVIVVGSVSVAGLGILTGVLPLLYPERGTQMSFMIQAVVLLISGVYYSVDVLPPWLRVFSYISPATYFLDGIRGAIIDGDGVQDLLGTLATLVLFGIVLVPGGIAVFAVAERWARKTGQLKRQGYCTGEPRLA